MSGFLGLIFGSGSGGSGPAPVTPSEYVAFAGLYNFSPAIRVYKWTQASGLGTSFTSPSFTNAFNQVSFVPDNSTISASITVAPYFQVWQWSTLGFGTKYSDPASPLDPSGNGATAYAWSRNVDALLTVNRGGNPSAPQAWAWSAATGFGTKYSNGSTFSSGQSMSINGDGTLVAFSANTAQSIHLYPWSSSGFGTKFANPSFPAGIAQKQGLSFNTVTNDLACGTSASPYIWAYSVTPSGFGTQYSNPSTPLASATNGLQFSPDGATIATVNSGAISVNAYRWGAGFGTKYANPAGLTNSPQLTIDWASTTNAIMSTYTISTPYVDSWKWSSSGFGTKYVISTSPIAIATNSSFSNKSR
jgi:hypothetical protein